MEHRCRADFKDGTRLVRHRRRQGAVKFERTARADDGGPGGNTTGFENLKAAGFDRGIRCGAAGVNV